MTTVMMRNKPFPERVLIEEMDRARRMAEDANRVHDTIAQELGFERVRICDVTAGDELAYVERGVRKWRTVEKIEERVDEIGTNWFAVGFRTDDHGAFVRNFEPHDFVSRRLPEFEEPF